MWDPTSLGERIRARRDPLVYRGVPGRGVGQAWAGLDPGP
jgi:hypothetical protein